MQERIDDQSLEESLLTVQKNLRGVRNPFVEVKEIKSIYEKLSGRMSSFLYLRFEYSDMYQYVERTQKVRFSDDFFHQLEQSGRISKTKCTPPKSEEKKWDYAPPPPVEIEGKKDSDFLEFSFKKAPSEPFKNNFFHRHIQKHNVVDPKDEEVKKLRKQIQLQKNQLKEQDEKYATLWNLTEKESKRLEAEHEKEKIKLRSRIQQLERRSNNSPRPVHLFNNNNHFHHHQQQEADQKKIKRLERKVELTKKYYRTILRKLGKNRLEIFKIDPNEIKMTGKRLGEGSFGTVYEAHWNVNRAIAVKELVLNVVSGGKSAKKDVINEFEMQVQLVHPNCLRVFGYSEHRENVINIIMEKMDMDLAKFLRVKKPLMSQKIDFMQMMAKSLFFLHHQKPEPLLHRDIKSQNFLVSDDGTKLKMCDFGLLKTMTCSMTFVQSQFKGTVLWMAPEIIEAVPQYSVYSDVYALGITFWEVLYMRMPFDHILKRFQGPSAQIFVLGEIKKGARPELLQNDGLPNEFRGMLRKMWHQEPRSRLKTDDLKEMFKTSEVERLKRLYGHLRFPEE